MRSRRHVGSLIARVCLGAAALTGIAQPASARFDRPPRPSKVDATERTPIDAPPTTVSSNGAQGTPSAAEGSVLPTPTGTTGFTVKGTQIFDPAGKPFIPVGMMVTGRHGASPLATLGITNTMAAWQFNTARIVTCLPPQCYGQPPGATGYRQNSDTDAIIRDLTARKAVAMLESYHVPAGAWPTPEVRVALGDWWEQQAIKYKDNPYVWFNVINEPGENPGWGQGAADPIWLDWMSYLAGRIRATGATNPIVLDGSNNGQDVQYDTLDGKLGRPDSSAIISFGPEILRRFDNIIFSLHTWELWGRGNTAQTTARFDDYFGRVHAFGGAIIIGEAGNSENGLEREGANIYIASRDAFRYAAEKKMGAIAFAVPNSLYPETVPDKIKPYNLTYANIGDASQINSLTNPTNLSKMGRFVWDYSHAIRAALPENAQMTPPIRSDNTVYAETFDGGSLPARFRADNRASLTISPGNGGGALSVTGMASGDAPSLRWDASGLLVPGRTYSVSIQAHPHEIPDPIHVAFEGGPNPDWPNNPSTNGWAWATLNNRSVSDWSQTDLVLRVPEGFTGQVTFTSNRGTPFSFDNVVITEISRS